MSRLLFALWVASGAGITALALPAADATRGARADAEALTFVPEARSLRVAMSGFHEPASDLFWVRTVILFGERLHDDPSGPWTEWLVRMVGAVTHLDPAWRTPYYYGGGILRVVGRIEASNEVFAAGTDAFPNDAFFPFSVGMNHYLYSHDPVAAASWLAKAAARPTAPSWYAAAAAAMKDRGGSRAAAITYLKEVQQTTDNEGVREDTSRQLGRLYHDELVDSWTEASRTFQAREGRPFRQVEELWSILGKAYQNPRGDAWVVGSDGVVRSEGAEGERRRDLRAEEWKLAGSR